MSRTTIALAAMLSAALGSAPPLAFADDPGYALRFDGASDQVRLAATSSLMAPTWPSTKTVSVWVNPTGSATCTAVDPGSCDAIFGDKPRAWGISRGTLAGADRIWVWNYDGTSDKIGIEYTTGEWIQVTLVHGGGVLSAYKNGILVGSVASGNTSQGSAQVLYFGGIINSTSKNWTFQGDIDEVRIWNIVRTEAEILGDMNVSLTGSEAGLAGYYTMSNGSGLSVADDSGHGWTGTFLDGGSGVAADGPIQWVPSGAFGTTSVVNVPPNADSQSINTDEDMAVPVTLTGSDADLDPLTFRVVSPPTKGILSGTAPDLIYTPLPNLNGTDSFTFVANDGHVDSAPATVTVTLYATNDAPVASNDTSGTQVDTPVVLAVLGNDTDIDGDTLVIVNVSAPTSGTVSHDGTTITYTPLVGFTGIDTFSYDVSDGNGGSASAQVSVTVSAGADPGYALQFDGTSDFVRLAPTSSMLAPGWQNTKTVSLWVKPVGTPYCGVASPPSCDAIFGDRPRWWGISRGVIGGLDRIWVWNYDGAIKALPIEYVAGEWTHIALVHGGGTLSAYKNGVLVGSVASAATLQPPGVPYLHLGGIINAVGREWTFKGDIDEVQLWNTARTAAEIVGDMTWPLTGSEYGLAAYYRMSNGTGTALTDDSGHGWTGELFDGGQGVPPDGPIHWVPSGAFTLPN